MAHVVMPMAAGRGKPRAGVGEHVVLWDGPVHVVRRTEPRACVCVRTCVRARVRARVRACARACICVRVCAASQASVLVHKQCWSLSSYGAQLSTDLRGEASCISCKAPIRARCAHCGKLQAVAGRRHKSCVSCGAELRARSAKARKSMVTRRPTP